jgi:heat shock protein HslJ
MAGYDYRYKLNMRTKLKSFLLTGLLFALLSGVRAQDDTTAAAPPPVKTYASPKMAGKWILIPALDSDTANGHIAEMQFDVKESKFSGNTGCNRMSGTFTATDSTIQFSDKMITTRMYCPGYNESAFLQSLLRVDNYKFRKGMLVFAVGNIEVLRWKKKPSPPKKTGPAPAK